MFVLELTPAETRDGMSSEPPKKVWAVVTRRNVPGYPPHRSDTFPTKAEAVAFYKHVVVETPRVSTGNKTPHPVPTLDDYMRWLVEQNLFDPLLNPGGAKKDA